jgi:WD40 repeat protein
MRVANLAMNAVTVRNVNVNTKPQCLVGHEGQVSDLAIRAERMQLVSVSKEDASARLWELNTGKELGRIMLPRQTTCACTDGQRVLVGRQDGSLELWDMNLSKLIRHFRGHSGSITAVVLAPDGTFALSGTADGCVSVWDLQ